jgi:hypothetical protein
MTMLDRSLGVFDAVCLFLLTLVWHFQSAIEERLVVQ